MQEQAGRIADRVFNRLLKGEFVSLRGLIEVAAKDGMQTLLELQASGTTAYTEAAKEQQ
jgi:hypothetical protein